MFDDEDEKNDHNTSNDEEEGEFFKEKNYSLMNKPVIDMISSNDEPVQARLSAIHYHQEDLVNRNAVRECKKVLTDMLDDDDEEEKDTVADLR